MKRIDHSTLIKDASLQMNKYRCSNHLCDVILVTQGREFPAHRVVLSSAGGFFDGLFTSNMKEKAENKISLHQIDYSVMDDILEYIYTGKIELTTENAQLVLMAVDFLLLDKLREPIDQFLAEISLVNPPDNCAAAYLFAVKYQCALLEDTSFNLIQKDFENNVCKYREFLDLPDDTFLDIISTNELETSCEEVVYKAIIEWVQHEESRKSVLYSLLSEVRWCSISEEFIKSVVYNEHVILKNPECMELVKTLVKFKPLPTTPNVAHPRDCLSSYTDAIFLFPKDALQFPDVVQGPWCYIPKENKWYYIEPPASYGRGVPLYHEGAIYLVDDESREISIARFELESKEWSLETVLDSYVYIRAHGKTCHQGTIYLIGGFKSAGKDEYGHDRFDTVSDVTAYSIDLQEELEISPMNSCRSETLVVCDDNFVYVLAGDSEEFVESNIVERYDPSNDHWEFLSQMKGETLVGATCALSRGKIYVFQPIYIKVEHYDQVYDIKDDTWFVIPWSMNLKPKTALVNCANNLYVFTNEIADSKPEENLFKTAQYNTRKKKWTEVLSHVRIDVHVNDNLSLGGLAVRLPKQIISTLNSLSHD